MSNKILLTSQYFPNIQYYTEIIKNPEIIIEAFENYQKRSNRNRCNIATSNGIQVLSVPLRKGKNNQLSIREVQISYDFNWQKQHWQSLQTAYGKSPFWEFYTPQLEKFFSKKYTFLFDLNSQILETTFDILKIKKHVNISFTEDYIKNYDTADIYDTRTLSDNFKAKRYAQVFEDRIGFVPNLSILDLIFCCGPQSLDVFN